MEKITYASLGSLGEDFHEAFEAALHAARKKLPRAHRLVIGGSGRKTAATFRDTNPADTREVIGEFASAGRGETRLAIAAARRAWAGWRDAGWPRRVAVLREAARLMEERQFRLAALLTLEAGKNRFEAIAEVSESIDLILYYCRQMEEHDGFVVAMGGTDAERTRSVLQPYGVWAVVAPFNFPLALATGMAAGALIAGNTVVFKPASDTPLAGWLLQEIFQDGGVPAGVVNFLTGPGRVIGGELAANPEVDGFVFTGSRAVGRATARRFSAGGPRPCITEMGGKNAAIVMPSARLDDAAEGVLRSAFGFGGQKCSACSRVYVHAKVARRFLELLLEKTRQIVIGDPAQRATFLGPLINSAAVAKYAAAVRLGRKEGRVLHGGRRLRTEFPHGFFVEPCIIADAPRGSKLFREEFFAPVLAVGKVASLDEAIALANDSEYGLTAGIFTQEERETEAFFARIEAGVAYANRRGGATTGAWPGVQSFGGWKNSGSSGKSALGPYYLQQFMREQSQTRMR